MARHVLIAAVTAPLLLVALACSSVPTLHFADDSDGGVEGGSSGGPCVRTGTELCNDGIDNDCNGKTDCADDACDQRYTCVDRAPDDWQLTALVEGSRPGCPTGFVDSTDVRSVAAASGATCACDCGGSASCTPSGIVAAFDNDSACNSGTENLGQTTDCDKVNGNGFAVGANTHVRATAGAAGACTPTKQGSPTPVRDGRTCSLPRVGGGCAGGQVCVPRTSNGYAVCATKPGNVACPGAFPKPHHTGTNATDTRTCGTCTCTSTPCTGEVKLYDDRDCENGVKLTLKATALPGTCAQVTNASFQARGYTATISGGCVVGTPAQATGTLNLANETTVCCK